MTSGEGQSAAGQSGREDGLAIDSIPRDTAAPVRDGRLGDSGPDATNQSPPPGTEDRPVHLYDAVATQRDQVLNAYDAQRSALLQAVAEQREAATAPIRAVRERQAMQAAASAGLRPADLQRAGGPLGANPLAAHKPYGSTAQARQQLVAADIVATLKMMIAEEVRAQLCALLNAADERLAKAAAAARTDTVPERHN